MKKGTDLLHSLQRYESTSCDRYSSPLGEIYLFGDDKSLRAVAFGSRLSDKNKFASFLQKRNGMQVDLAVKFLDSYFQGKGNKIPVKISLLKIRGENAASTGERLFLDISRFTGKEQKVYESLLRVKPGKTVSYGKLAEKSDNPGAARFVGTTMAKNLFPIIIPCHRVIKGDGTRGFYSGGVKIKDFLLDYESH